MILHPGRRLRNSRIVHIEVATGLLLHVYDKAGVEAVLVEPLMGESHGCVVLILLLGGCLRLSHVEAT